MRSRTILFGLIVTGAAAVALLILIGNDRQQPQQEIAGLKVELAALRTALQQQAGASRRVEGSGVAPEMAAHPAARPQSRLPDQADPGSPARPEERARRQDDPPQMTHEQAQALVLDAYAEEAVDSTWSAKATGTLSAVVRDHLPGGSQLTSLECRATMCQVKLVHTDPRAHSSFLMDGFMGWPGSVFVAGQAQDRGKLAVTLIALREGAELPLE